MKVFVIIEHGSVTDVYADSNKVEVEVIDLDSLDEEDSDAAKKRADEVQAFYTQVL